VRSNDAVDLVGDEALVCARACPEVPVVVGPTRQAALDLALSLSDVAVLDGVHQTAPRATLALLAVDPLEPWGAGACPPRGDLRAPPDALLEIADGIVPVASTSRGAFLGRELLPWEALRGLRVGFASALARPSRVLRMLLHHGVRPRVVRTFSDHGRARLEASTAVELWLTTAKCAASLGLPPDAHHAVLEHHVTLDRPTLIQLRRLTLAQLGSYARRTA
jgi:tetraacyldisaccharide-1-P 4'-kinase